METIAVSDGQRLALHAAKRLLRRARNVGLQLEHYFLKNPREPMFDKFSYRSLIVAFLISVFTPLISSQQEYDCLFSRHAFPSTCLDHFAQNTNLVGSWMEATDEAIISSFDQYRHLIPRVYEADCCQCFDCGGVRFTLYRECQYPTDGNNQGEAFDFLSRTHSRPVLGGDEYCQNDSDHCEKRCWNGGYFRLWNQKYIHFFKHFLGYSLENRKCRCYWPELDRVSEEINNRVYDLLRDLAEANAILPDFSPYWKGTSRVCNLKFCLESDYFPNPHGMASSLTTYTFFYSQYHQMLLSVIDYIDSNEGLNCRQATRYIEDIYQALDSIQDLFYTQYRFCLMEHPHPKIYYERGMINLHKERYEDALIDVKNLMHTAAGTQLSPDFFSGMYQQEGQVYNELGMYDQAIQALTKALQADPNNKDAHFHRALAYFETGNFDRAISDYLASEKSKKTTLKVSQVFCTELMNGIVAGGQESMEEFIPSLCSSAYGFGECLWKFSQEPLLSTTNFCNACYDIGVATGEYLGSLNAKKMEAIADELKQACSDFNNLSDEQKGWAIGHCIGKYGVEIFAGGAVLKSPKLYKKLRDANRLANLEALAGSAGSKEAVTAAALAHAAKREAFFKNVKIHWGRQNKHVPGKHNYIEGRSVFEHPDAQSLLDKFAGTGVPVKGRTVSHPDYRENVNFGEIIGYHVEERTGIKTSTMWGDIRYSATGAHIVPTLPPTTL